MRIAVLAVALTCCIVSAVTGRDIPKVPDQFVASGKAMFRSHSEYGSFDVDLVGLRDGHKLYLSANGTWTFPDVPMHGGAQLYCDGRDVCQRWYNETVNGHTHIACRRSAYVEPPFHPEEWSFMEDDHECQVGSQITSCDKWRHNSEVLNAMLSWLAQQVGVDELDAPYVGVIPDGESETSRDAFFLAEMGNRDKQDFYLMMNSPVGKWHNRAPTDAEWPEYHFPADQCR